ncbi:MAG TPA: hemerythrin domain-containing protein [Nannocystis sp.]
MPDPPIWDILRDDHRELADIVSRLGGADDEAARELVARLTREFTAHARAEEAVVYGLLLHDESIGPRVLTALEEHKRIETAVAELERIHVGDERWSTRLAVFGDLLREHVQAEENELLARARQTLSELQASELGQRFAAERARLMRDLSDLDAPP